MDINDGPGCQALAGRLAGRRFDLILINAGIYGDREWTADTATPHEVGDIMFTNAVAPIRLARMLLPLLADGGTMAFMSSRMGSVAANTTGGGDLYRASKAALNSMTRGFAAHDVAGRPVAVLSLHPGWVRTAMGGAGAPLSVEQSVRGLADVLGRAWAPGHSFLDYQGETIPW